MTFCSAARVDTFRSAFSGTSFQSYTNMQCCRSVSATAWAKGFLFIQIPPTLIIDPFQIWISSMDICFEHNNLHDRAHLNRRPNRLSADWSNFPGVGQKFNSILVNDILFTAITHCSSSSLSRSSSETSSRSEDLMIAHALVQGPVRRNSDRNIKNFLHLK